MTPLPSVDYRVIISHNDTEITSQIDNIDVTGIAMTVSNLRGKVALAFKTNQKTAQLIKTKTYSLVIHNGSQLKVTSFKFDGQLQVSKIIGYQTLFSGINLSLIHI